MHLPRYEAYINLNVLFALFSMHSQIKDIENNTNVLKFNYSYLLGKAH